jgi:hypothetical protein
VELLGDEAKRPLRVDALLADDGDRRSRRSGSSSIRRCASKM